MLDLRIQSLPPETLAAQRPTVEPVRPAVTPAAAASEGNGNGGAANNGGAETPRDQYVSPFITIDPTSGLVITQYRNSATGELQQQYPSEKVVREYRNMQPPTVSPSGGRGPAAPGQASGSLAGEGDVVTIGRVASGLGQGNPTPAPTPAPAAAPAAPVPVQAPAAPAPTGGVDKGRA